VSRARKLQRFLSQPFHVAEQFTGMQGKYVKLEDTIKGFKEIVDGKHDEIPEQAFWMQGTIEDVLARAEQLKAAVVTGGAMARHVSAGSGHARAGLLVNEQVPRSADPGRQRLPGHPAGATPALLAELGAVRIEPNAVEAPPGVKIDGGWVEVADDHVRVLANTAEKSGE